MSGRKEFLDLFVLQMGHLRQRPDGRVVNSWFKIWSFFVKIEQAFGKICCPQKRARSLWGHCSYLGGDTGNSLQAVPVLHSQAVKPADERE